MKLPDMIPILQRCNHLQSSVFEECTKTIRTMRTDYRPQMLAFVDDNEEELDPYIADRSMQTQFTNQSKELAHRIHTGWQR